MFKILFKSAIKHWYAFLLCLYSIFGALACVIFGIAMPFDEIGVPGIITIAISLILFAILTSLPLLMITIPAARTVSLEKGTSVKKNWFIYHGCIVLLIMVITVIAFIYYFKF